MYLLMTSRFTRGRRISLLSFFSKLLNNERREEEEEEAKAAAAAAPSQPKKKRKKARENVSELKKKKTLEGKWLADGHVLPALPLKGLESCYHKFVQFKRILEIVVSAAATFPLDRGGTLRFFFCPFQPIATASHCALSITLLLAMKYHCTLVKLFFSLIRCKQFR